MVAPALAGPAHRPGQASATELDVLDELLLELVLLELEVVSGGCDAATTASAISPPRSLYAAPVR